MPEPEPTATPDADAPQPGRSAAGTVAVGILASRLVGFGREALTAYFLGAGAHADVFRIGLRMPNVLQNLLGEGTISAAFIPIYSRLLDEGREEEAGRFAGAIFGLLLAVVAAIVLGALWAAPYLVALLTPGFVADAQGPLPPLVDVIAGAVGSLGDSTGVASPVDRYALTVHAVRLIFPMTGVLVLSAWALGVLNSHRRFLLPYFAPVLWNVAIIAGLCAGAALLTSQGGLLDPKAIPLLERADVLNAAFVGALVGGVLQFGVQVPLVWKLLSGFRVRVSTKVTGVREALRATGPVLAGRGAAQLSSYLDQFLASFLASGAIAALGYAQVLYLLPVSLFGLSVAASELPELSRLGRANEAAFMARLTRSLRQIAFLVLPTAVGYVLFGRLIVGAVFEHGEMGAAESWLTFVLLGGYSLGLLATTLARLLQNSFWALNDTKTPAKIAIFRILFSAAVSVPLMFWLDTFPVARFVPAAPDETPVYLGALGLTLGASLGAFVEIVLLRRALRAKLPSFRLPRRSLLAMTGLALAAAGPAALVWWLLPDWSYLVTMPPVVGVYGLAYLAAAHAAGWPEAEAWTGRLAGRFLKRR